MKKFQIVLGIVVFLFFVTGLIYAESAGSLKIAYIDLSRVFDEYGKTKEYDAALEKKHGEYQQTHNQKLEKIKEAQGKLALLKDDEKTKLQSQLDKDKQELLEFDRQKQMDLRKVRDEEIREILNDIEKVVKDFAAKEGYTLILNDRVLIFGDQNFNVSQAIIKLLNEKYTPPKQ